MARFLLDTQAFVVLVTEGIDRFSRNVRETLVNLDHELLFSTVSLSEIAIKTSIGKLAFTSEKVRRAVADLRLTTVPYTPAHAKRLFDLPLHHRDPFDRMLIATALVEAVPILTGDQMFKR